MKGIGLFIIHNAAVAINAVPKIATLYSIIFIHRQWGLADVILLT